MLRGDPLLAERYAVHVIGAYQHYRWRAYLRDCERRGVSPWQSLDPDPSRWQGKNTDARRVETGVWLSVT